MIHIRKSAERGYFDHGWLKTFHTFSFSDYYDPNHMHFRSLRVINEDVVQPSDGFDTHAHRDMEIITYILSGELEHKDSMGNGSVIRPGEIQYMSAGKGVTHSEFNPSKTTPVHLLQIWIMPQEHGLKPRYAQKSFSKNDLLGKLFLLASPDGEKESISIRQDAKIFATILDSGMSVSHSIAPKRNAWIQVARGSIDLNGEKLKAGDGASVSSEMQLTLTADDSTSEVLLFDLA